MEIAVSTRRYLFLGPLVAALAGVGLLVVGTGAGSAVGGALRAESVCEAHELRARKAADPHLEIEIPAEYDKKLPSYEACIAHEEAWDDQAPGPRQPIPFSHKHHAGLYQIECQYCHSNTGESPAAGVPSVELCMGCHAQFPASYDELEGIRILKEHWGQSYEKQNGTWKALPRDPEQSKPIEWEQIHRVPEHVQFRHNRHLKAGVDCQTCHGQVAEMHKLYLTPDTIWWPWLLPAQKLEMGWCIDCHRENGASQDCYTCHY